MNREFEKILSDNEFEPTFENGGFWELYSDLERKFCNFLEYVPYLPENEKTYSFKLFNLLTSIGGYIDSTFKEMARYTFQEPSENKSCQRILERAKDKKGIFTTSIDVFDTIYGIRTKKVKFKCLPDREVIVPFSNGCREWWRFYNKVKHEIRFNLTKANLKNVRDSIAGAFLLNAIHIPGAIRLHKYGVYKEKLENLTWDFEERINNHEYAIGETTTSIFIYDYDQ